MIIKTDEFTTDRFDNDNTWSAVCEVTTQEPPSLKQVIPKYLFAVEIKKVYQEGNEVENIDELPKSMKDFIREDAIEKYKKIDCENDLFQNKGTNANMSKIDDNGEYVDKKGWSYQIKGE